MTIFGGLLQIGNCKMQNAKCKLQIEQRRNRVPTIFSVFFALGLHGTGVVRHKLPHPSSVSGYFDTIGKVLLVQIGDTTLFAGDEDVPARLRLWPTLSPFSRSMK
jgi:hypothetical protein